MSRLLRIIVVYSGIVAYALLLAVLVAWLTPGGKL